MSEQMISETDLLQQNPGEYIGSQNHKGRRYELEASGVNKQTRIAVEAFCNDILSRNENIKAGQRYCGFADGNAYTVLVREGNLQNNRTNHVLEVYRAQSYELTAAERRMAVGYAALFLDILMKPDRVKVLTLPAEAVPAFTKLLAAAAVYLNSPLIDRIPVLIQLSDRKHPADMVFCDDPEWIKTMLMLTEMKKDRLSVNVYNELKVQCQSLTNISLDKLLNEYEEKSLNDLYQAFFSNKKMTGIRAMKTVDLAAYMCGIHDSLPKHYELTEEDYMTMFSLLDAQNQKSDRAAGILLENNRSFSEEVNQYAVQEFEALYEEETGLNFDRLNKLIVYTQFLQYDPLQVLTSKLLQLSDRERKNMLLRLLPRPKNPNTQARQWQFLKQTYAEIRRAFSKEKSDLNQDEEYHLLFWFCQFDIRVTDSRIRLERLSERNQYELEILAERKIHTLKKYKMPRWVRKYPLFRNVYHDFVREKRRECVQVICDSMHTIMYQLRNLVSTF